MEGITRNIDRPLKDLNGGIYTIYLLPYVRYSRSQITIEDQKLISLPATDIYKVYASTKNFTQNTETEGGAVFYKQNFTLEIPKTEIGSQVYRLVNKKYRAIIQDSNDNWRMLGLFNGLKCSYTNTTGTNKNEFSGYSITFEGTEDRQALYTNSITEAGTPTEIYNFVFQDGSNYVFQDNKNYIFN